MKSIFVRLVAVLLVLFLVVAGIGYFLPHDYEITSTVEIEASPDAVFPLINHVPNWKLWSPWNPDKIQDLKITYSPTEEGVGAGQ